MNNKELLKNLNDLSNINKVKTLNNFNDYIKTSLQENEEQAKAAAERLKKAREAEAAASAGKQDDFDSEAANAQSTATTVSVNASDEANIPRDPKSGKRLDMWDQKDADHNRKVADYTFKKALARKEAGENVDLKGMNASHQERQEDIIKDIKWREQTKAVEKGLDTFADVVGLVPGAGDVVDLVHSASYAARGALAGNEEEAAEYRQKAVDQAVYGLLMPAGINLAAKGVAKGAGAVTRGASDIIGKGAAGEKITSKAADYTKKVMDLNPIGAAAGGFGAMQAVSDDASLGTKLAVGFAGAILGGNAVKHMNKIPGLGKVVQDPSGSLPFYAGKAVGGTGRTINRGLEAIPKPNLPDLPNIPQAVKDKARVGVAAGSMLFGQGPAAMGPFGGVALKPETVARSVEGSGFVSPKQEGGAVEIKVETPKVEQQRAQEVAPDIAILNKQAETARIRAQEQQQAKSESNSKEETKPKTKQETKPEAKPKGGGGFVDGSGPKLLDVSKQITTPQYGFSSTRFAQAGAPVFMREIGAQTAGVPGPKRAFSKVQTESNNLNALVAKKLQEVLESKKKT